MLKSIVLLAFLAAVKCAHITTVEEVNKLVDRTINEIIKEKELTVPEFPDVKIEGLDKLKRDGNCVKTAQAGIFQCSALSEESQLSTEGEKDDVIVRVTFEVVVDTEGHLIRYDVNTVDIDLKNPEDSNGQPEDFGLGKKLKKIWKKVKHVVEQALHEVIKKKVTDIVISIANGILG